MSWEYQRAWGTALIEILKRSGAPVQEPPTTDDIPLVAEHLGVDILDLVDLAHLEARYCLATVQN